jgi:hypothetical protein
MGVLANPDHERFCQEVHRRILVERETRAKAQTAAYRLCIYTGKENALDDAIAPNARKLAQKKHVRARIRELGEFAAKLAGIDRDWALVELKMEAEAVKGFNLDDYLGPPDELGNRYYDLSGVSREKLGMLVEYSMESAHEAGATKGDPGREIRKVRLKGPNKVPDRVAILRLMAEIAGWKAPTKIAPTTPEGDMLPIMDVSDEDRARALQAFLAKTVVRSDAA